MLRVPVPLPAGDTVTARCVLPRASSQPGSALLPETKALPLFRAAVQKKLFSKDTDCLSTGRQ